MESTRVEMEGGQGREAESGAESRRIEAVAAWLASGEELRPYCERTGQSVWSLRRWRCEHADRFGLSIKRRPGAKGQAVGAAAASMIPVELVGPAKSMAGSMTIEVRLARQRSLVLPSDIDGAALARLVTAVEAAP